MSTCSAEDIAEKRRIALEKLRAKKEQRANNVTTTTKQIPPKVNDERTQAFINALKQTSMHYKNKRPLSHPYPPPGQLTKKPLLAPSPPKVAPIRAVTCQIYMTSRLRFAVQSSDYHVKLIEIFKSIPSKSYDNNTRIWSFSLNDYEMLQERMFRLKPSVVIGAIPKNVINLCLTEPKEVDRSCLASIESHLAEQLLPFQQDGVCFAIAQHGRIMFCDEMGLGKTYQALAVADFYKEDWPLLICTTASTRDIWATQIRELLPSIPLHYIQVLTNTQQYIGDVKVLITSYNMMEKHEDKLLSRKFGSLIFDESHNLKNNKAKCTATADRLAKRAKHVILLSGTPALSRPLELFTQIQMIDRKFMNFIDFTTRYCDGKPNQFGWDANGQSNLQELNVVLKLKFMVRRTKADVLPELAEKSRETVLLDPALVWSNNETKESLNTFNAHFNASKGREREELLLKFYARTAEVKTRAVCAYLKTLIKDKIKFIVFAHHRVMLNAICECMSKLNVNYIRIDGATKNETRAEYINTFQRKTACQVAVLSLKACNAGITLTAAEMIVFAELDWNPSTLAQAESRAHRIGQLKPVICRYLMATNTADDVIWNMLKAKQDVLNRAGLFCENLQAAKHTTAPTTSGKIEHYFSPGKVKTTPAVDGTNERENSSVINNNNNTHKKNDNLDISKELENVDALFKDDDTDAFFNEDDDEAFKDLPF